MKKFGKFISALLLAILIPCVVLVCVILGASLMGKDFSQNSSTEVTSETISTAAVEEAAVSEESVSLPEETANSEASTLEEPPFSESIPVAMEDSDPSSKITKELTENVAFALATDSKKFHFTNCTLLENITPSNLAYFSGTREEAISITYLPCENCNP